MADGRVGPHFQTEVPSGDDLERSVCQRCGFVAYENPKVVVGSVVRSGEQILLCRRAIEPRKGLWTLPAGFLELHETPEEGARREAYEEACANIAITGLLSVYTIARLSQVQLIYRAELSGGFAPGAESLDVALFSAEAIPWAQIAFPSVHWALTHEAAARAGGVHPPFANPADADGDLAAFVAGSSV